ncbi:unnamed protein product [Auanema sp. JU1783]|nr:unnamed protein product [Auanema sp. JU1783]
MAGRKKRKSTNRKARKSKEDQQNRSNKGNETDDISVITTAYRLRSTSIDNGKATNTEKEPIEENEEELSAPSTSSERKRRYTISSNSTDKLEVQEAKRRQPTSENNTMNPRFDSIEEENDSEAQYCKSNTIFFEDFSDENDEDNSYLENAEFVRIETALNDEKKMNAPAPLHLTETSCRGMGTPEKVWNLLVRKDVVVRPEKLVLKNQISPSMRAVLVDWMMELCESEKQHRETFHLSIDYLDRFLAAHPDLSLNELQCIGTTAIFIASKYEEIYPPKLENFVEYTAGACDEAQVRQSEILMLCTLNWSLSPLTSIHWLNIYMQLLGNKQFERDADKHVSEKPFTVPAYLREEYMHMSKVLDIACLDVDVHTFSYREVAAAVLFACYEPHNLVSSVTGFTYEGLLHVVDWIEPCVRFCEKRRVAGDPLPVREDIRSEEWHNIQTHYYDVTGEQTFIEIREQRAQQKKRVEGEKCRLLSHRSAPLRPRCRNEPIS